MAKIPVVCDFCKTFWITENIFGGDWKNITFVNTKVGPCPNCGKHGRIPDGTYDFIGNTIELVGGPSSTVADLNRLEEILRNARAAGLGSEKLEEKINEDLPSFSQLANLLPRTRGELYAFIAIILTVIGLALQAKSNNKSPDITINQVINNVTNEINITSNVTAY